MGKGNWVGEQNRWIRVHRKEGELGPKIKKGLQQMP
jgi:hypothetical protein